MLMLGIMLVVPFIMMMPLLGKKEQNFRGGEKKKEEKIFKNYKIKRDYSKEKTKDKRTPEERLRRIIKHTKQKGGY